MRRACNRTSVVSSSSPKHVLAQDRAELCRTRAFRCCTSSGVGTVWWYWLRGSDRLWCVLVSEGSVFNKADVLCAHLLVAGASCVELNDYYSQCQPGAAAPPPPSSTVATQPPAPTTSTPAGGGLSSIPASTLHQISNFGTNPNNVAVYAYKPAKVQAKPPLVVAIHCTSHSIWIKHDGLAHCICRCRLLWYRTGLLPGLPVRPAVRDTRLCPPLPLFGE